MLIERKMATNESATTTKKSACKLRRLEKRARERGEKYIYNPEPAKEVPSASVSSAADETKYNAARKLKSALDELEENPNNINSKDRRSAKRKAEAIAIEEVNASTEGGGESETENKIATADELLEWLTKNQDRLQKKKKKKAYDGTIALSPEDEIKLKAATKYQKALADIEMNEELNSKDRRSAKRKADAIAVEDCQGSSFENIESLLEWHETYLINRIQNKKKRKAKELTEDGESNKKTDPYILFVGQIPFEITPDEIFKHFKKYMNVGRSKVISSREDMIIRIPQDEKAKPKTKTITNDDGTTTTTTTKRHKGFAFCEFQNPEIMFECLKMHHTSLNGRRINVIRAAGGGKAARTEKHKQRKKEQDDYISSTVDRIVQEHIDRGDLKDGELDNGAILLCKRRSAALVEMALGRYIEERTEKTNGGSELENPSAYFTNLMCRITDEDPNSKSKGKGAGKTGDSSPSSKRGGGGKGGEKKAFRAKDSSVFTKSGVDMSISTRTNDGKGGSRSDLSKIFPSSRGRGRGRGAYMR
mmetsp:Transcript_25951/g.38429  ORF Transcript_25951/g.38429 Transcript_25951/m.38429 type:complete len:534 (+) Transcript_25951:55-1656(+)